MELYSNISHVDKKVSRIFFGTQSNQMCMGQDSTEVLDSVVACGIQTLDTARAYTASEKVIGDWMKKRGNRNDLVILSKGGHPSAFGRKRINDTDIRKDLERSLKYLQTDYIDIYLLHRDDPDVPVAEICEIMNALHNEGKIGAFGGSNWSVKRIQELNDYAHAHDLIPFEVSSPHYGLAEQIGISWDNTCESITGAGKAADRKWYADTQIPVIAYSSLGRGLMSGKFTSNNLDDVYKYMDEPARKGYAYEANFKRLARCEELAKEKGCLVPQIALAWMFYQGMNVYSIISTTNPERMKRNLAALDIQLTPEECKYLNLED
ncbi:MAG: aldo/keto reductase [Lachnospiraceae bacterium]|nr:aldo/keto reductase [Lachnospiraceae bacterium]